MSLHLNAGIHMTKGKKKATAIESLEKQLRKRFPEAIVSIDPPAKRRGSWFLDVRRNGHFVVIQWREGAGFGISSAPDHAYGEGADEVYQDEEAAYGRTVSLLLSGTHTAPPEPVRLRELRKERGISQAELAALLKTQQGAVSKLERRHDMLISTVRDVVQSMGGSLRIIARFPDGVERVLQFEDDIAKRKSRKQATARQMGGAS
jgi:DNA-binding transcriptional regulator YiaG